MSGGSKKQETNQVTNTQSQQSGTTTQDSSGVTTGANYQFQTPIAPDGWEAAWRGFDLGPSGLTPAQQAGLDAIQGNIGGATRLTTDPTVSLIGAAANGAAGYGDTFTLAQLQKQFPELYGAIANVAPQSVTAQTGADFMNLYRNPFEDQVVNSTLDDLQRKYALEATARGNARQAAGAFGGSASALGDALAQNDYLRTVAATAGNLRSQGFNAAAGLGQTDASRALQAAGMNQASDLQAQTQNQNNQTARQEFDVNAAYKGQDTRNQAAQQWANTVASALGIDNATALALIGAAGTGQAQGLNWLNMGGRLFGQEGGGLSYGTNDQSSKGSFDTTGNSTSTTNGTITQTSSPGLLDVIGALGGLATGLGGLGWAPFAP